MAILILQHAKIKPGKYILTEEQAPEGYVIANEVEFELKETGEIQKVTMVDDHTKINFIKEDEEGNGVKGAVFNFTEKESGKVVYTLTTNGENHLIEKMLVSGKTYIVEEVKVPEGYEKAETFEFEVKNTGEVQEIKVINKKIKKEEPKPNIPRTIVRTGIEKGYIFYILAGICGSIAIFLIKKKKRKKEKKKKRKKL